MKDGITFFTISNLVGSGMPEITVCFNNLIGFNEKVYTVSPDGFLELKVDI